MLTVSQMLLGNLLVCGTRGAVGQRSSLPSDPTSPQGNLTNFSFVSSSITRQRKKGHWKDSGVDELMESVEAPEAKQGEGKR